jgi:hypothetical protein
MRPHCARTTARARPSPSLLPPSSFSRTRFACGRGRRRDRGGARPCGHEIGLPRIRRARRRTSAPRAFAPRPTRPREAEGAARRAVRRAHRRRRRAAGTRRSPPRWLHVCLQSSSQLFIGRSPGASRLGAVRWTHVGRKPPAVWRREHARRQLAMAPGTEVGGCLLFYAPKLLIPSGGGTQLLQTIRFIIHAAVAAHTALAARPANENQPFSVPHGRMCAASLATA